MFLFHNWNNLCFILLQTAYSKKKNLRIAGSNWWIFWKNWFREVRVSRKFWPIFTCGQKVSTKRRGVCLHNLSVFYCLKAFLMTDSIMICFPVTCYYFSSWTIWLISNRFILQGVLVWRWKMTIMAPFLCPVGTFIMKPCRSIK